jgi:ATP-dependent Clp endopeptidase proteolytic subunit ClpP
METRPMRSTRRLQNMTSTLPKWYSITNSAAGQPTQVAIYDEIGFFGVPAGEFMADLKGINGDLELHINSPGGDVHDGLAIFNQLKQRKGVVAVIIDGLAASAASFIAQAASPGKLEMSPHSQMMIHNGFSMGIGDAADLRKTADLLDMVTTEIASIYAERSGKPVAFWQEMMSAETWFTDKAAVEAGLADRILGDEPAQDSWDLSVYGKSVAPVNSDGHGVMNGTHSHTHQAYGGQGSDATHAHEHGHDGDFSHEHAHATASDAAGQHVQNAGNGGWQQRGGKWVFDPDNDGDNDGTAAGDKDHDYWDASGKQIKAIPPDPDGKQGKPLAPGQKGNRAMFPVLLDEVDESPWDASRAWHNGAASDDPAAFYRGICAGRKSGDPATQDAWALPYRYTPSSPVNAAGVRAGLARLSSTQGLTNAAQAKSTLEKAMKQVNPDWDPDDGIDPASLRAALHLDAPGVDGSDWDPAVAWALGAESADPAWYYSQICAGRRPGSSEDQASYALPYRYGPEAPPNSQGVRDCMARLSGMRLTNEGQARATLETAMRQVDPDGEPDDHIDTGLLAALFSTGLEGAAR